MPLEARLKDGELQEGRVKGSLLYDVGLALTLFAASIGLGGCTTAEKQSREDTQQQQILQEKRMSYDEIKKTLENASYEVVGEKFEDCDSCVLYVPEIHLFHALTSESVKEIQKLLPVGIIGIEGLEGKIGSKEMQKIKNTLDLAVKFSEDRQSLSNEWSERLKDHPSYEKSFYDFYASVLGQAIAIGRLSNDEIISIGTPGLKHANALYKEGDDMLFGVEDKKLFDQQVQIILARRIQTAYESLQDIIADAKKNLVKGKEKIDNKTENIIKYMESMLPLYEQILKHYQKITGKDDIKNAYDEALSVRRSGRSHIAVENLRAQMIRESIPLGLLIYGENHLPSVTKALKEKKQSYLIIQN